MISISFVLWLAVQTPQILLEDTVFRVPSPPQGASLTVFAGAGANVPPMLGASSLKGRDLVFLPRFPLVAGQTYRAVLSWPGGRAEAAFTIPRRDVPATAVVESVYPSSSVVPENLLKFYIHFSAPMSRGEAYQRLHLLDERNRPVAAPFLELNEELWDAEGQRFTLFFDPGRIKRGLVPNQEMGVPLVAGRQYTLVVDRDWKDAEGAPMKAEFRKSFRVVEADRTMVGLEQWKLTSPAASTRQPLSVEFPEPLDRALLMRLMEVADLSGHRVPGVAEIDREETRWRFTPNAEWKAGDYHLVADVSIADVAGNRIDRPFDVDVFEKIDEHLTRETKPLRFTVSPARR